MNVLRAYTDEIDDVNLAVTSLLEQLDLERQGQSHCVGILTCYPEFVDTGVVAQLCRALPFDVVGCMSPGNGMQGVTSDMMLALTVLTGEDVFFSTASIPVETEAEMKNTLAACYQRAVQTLPQEPKLVIPFIPQTQNYYNELVFQELDAVCGSVPLFGTFVLDKTVEELPCHTIYNGAATPETVSLLLIAGEVQPRFYWSSVRADKVYQERATVTASDGYLLREVNHMPIRTYLEGLGLTSEESLEGVKASPVCPDGRDGRSGIARTMWAVTQEGARVKGAIPTGASIAVGALDFEELTQPTQKLLEEVAQRKDIAGVLAFPCIAREFALGGEALTEIALMAEVFGTQIPYHACFSGGELCPVEEQEGGMSNKLHNFTFVMCAL